MNHIERLMKGVELTEIIPEEQRIVIGELKHIRKELSLRNADAGLSAKFSGEQNTANALNALRSEGGNPGLYKRIRRLEAEWGITVKLPEGASNFVPGKKLRKNKSTESRHPKIKRNQSDVVWLLGAAFVAFSVLVIFAAIFTLKHILSAAQKGGITEEFTPEIVHSGNNIIAVRGALRLFPIGDIHADVNMFVEVLQHLGLIKQKKWFGRTVTVDDVLRKPAKYITLQRGDVMALAGDMIDSHIAVEPNDAAIEGALQKIRESLSRENPNLDTLRLIRALQAVAQNTGAVVMPVMGNHEDVIREVFKYMREKGSPREENGILVLDGGDTTMEEALEMTIRTAGKHGFLDKYVAPIVYAMQEFFTGYATYKELLNGRNSWLVRFIEELPLVAVVDNAVIVHPNIPRIDLLNIPNFNILDKRISDVIALKGSLDWFWKQYANKWYHETGDAIYREHFNDVIRKLMGLPQQARQGKDQNMYLFVAHYPNEIPDVRSAPMVVRGMLEKGRGSNFNKNYC